MGVQNNLAINIYASRNFITPELPLLSLSSVCRTNNRSSYRGGTLPRVQPPSGFWDGNRIEHIYRTRQWDESRSGPFFTDHEPSSSWWRWWWHSCSFVGRIISQSCVESYPGLTWPDPTSTPYEQERSLFEIALHLTIWCCFDLAQMFVWFSTPTQRPNPDSGGCNDERRLR